jgi:hypothetical protein
MPPTLPLPAVGVAVKGSLVFLVGLLLLREAVTLSVLYLVAQKAESDFQVSVLLLAAIAYRRLLFQTKWTPEREELKHLRGYDSAVSVVTDVIVGIALIVVIFR